MTYAFTPTIDHAKSDRLLEYEQTKPPRTSVCRGGSRQVGSVVVRGPYFFLLNSFQGSFSAVAIVSSSTLAS